MPLKIEIKELNRQAKVIGELTRKLSLSCSNFNGVAAIIPDNPPHPASYFKGQRTLLHNVRYDPDACAIAATISIPYNKDAKEVRRYSYSKYKYNIDETWFK